MVSCVILQYISVHITKPIIYITEGMKFPYTIENDFGVVGFYDSVVTTTKGVHNCMRGVQT